MARLNHSIGCILFLIGVSFITTSCFSVKYSTSGASISPDIKTASIVYFTNRATLAPATLSQQFTEKLREKVRSNTSLNILNEGGDVNFEGEITGFSTAPTSISKTDKGEDLAARNRLTVTVHVKYTNSVEPKFNFDSNFSRFADYNSDQNLEAAASTLLPEILELISEDVFNKAFVNW